STIWVKDYRQTVEVVAESYEKAETAFHEMLEAAAGVQIVSKPEDLFESGKAFKKGLERFTLVEFGKRFNFKNAEVVQFQAHPQPSFNKDFQRLVQNLHENQSNGYVNVIAAESPRQADRLTTIFDELD